MTDANTLAKLKDRIEKATKGDREIDTDLAIALFDIPEEAARSFPVAKIERSKTWSNHTIDVFPVGSLRATISFEPPAYTASVDAALSLVPKAFPNTDDKRYHGVVWFGHRPAARIFYDVRDPNAEGGWATGALNDREVRGATPALALLSALLAAIIAKQETADANPGERDGE